VCEMNSAFRAAVNLNDAGAVRRPRPETDIHQRACSRPNPTSLLKYTLYERDKKCDTLCVKTVLEIDSSAGAIVLASGKFLARVGQPILLRDPSGEGGNAVPYQRFAIERNVDRLHSHLQAEGDANKRDLLLRLLVEEENKLGSDRERHAILCQKLSQGKIAIEKQNVVVKSIMLRGLDATNALEFLKNLIISRRIIGRLLETLDVDSLR